MQDIAAHLITAIDRYVAGLGAGMQRAVGFADLSQLSEELSRERTGPLAGGTALWSGTLA